jgi:hypothetical protein
MSPLPNTGTSVEAIHDATTSLELSKSATIASSNRKRDGARATLYWSRNGRFRVWGVMALPGAMFDAFTETDKIREVANNLYTSILHYLQSNSYTERNASGGPTFSSLYQKTNTPTQFKGSMGMSGDYTSLMSVAGSAMEFQNIKTGIVMFFAQKGINVRVQEVADAFTIGNPGPSRRDLQERDGSRVCRNPVDLRDYFTSDDPDKAIPDSYSYC